MTTTRWLLCLLFAPALAAAQTPPTDASQAAAPAPDIAAVSSLSWLYGCWGGKVNQRDFREQWMPLRGNMMLGVGSTVLQDKVQSFEYLRIESRADGVYYVATPAGKAEDAFKLVSATVDEKEGATIFTFSSPEHDFPQRIVYRRGTEGWLYATVEGKYNGQDNQVTYPMRRIDCESGEFIRN